MKGAWQRGPGREPASGRQKVRDSSQQRETDDQAERQAGMPWMWWTCCRYRCNIVRGANPLAGKPAVRTFVIIGPNHLAGQAQFAVPQTYRGLSRRCPSSSPSLHPLTSLTLSLHCTARTLHLRLRWQSLSFGSCSCSLDVV